MIRATAHVLCVAALGLTGQPAAWSQQIDRFDTQGAPLVPEPWSCGVTGRGTPIWRVVPDSTAPSTPNVLAQSGSATFTWCVRSQPALVDGFAQVRFKAIGGKQDRAAGLVWRFHNASRYYVARANALENNVALYYTDAGVRHTIRYVDAAVALGQWHILRVDFEGERIRVSLNGQAVIDLHDARIQQPGRVGVWTKADSLSAFDDFEFAARR